MNNLNKRTRETSPTNTTPHRDSSHVLKRHRITNSNASRTSEEMAAATGLTQMGALVRTMSNLSVDGERSNSEGNLKSIVFFQSNEI